MCNDGSSPGGSCDAFPDDCDTCCWWWDQYPDGNDDVNIGG